MPTPSRRARARLETLGPVAGREELLGDPALEVDLVGAPVEGGPVGVGSGGAPARVGEGVPQLDPGPAEVGAGEVAALDRAPVEVRRGIEGERLHRPVGRLERVAGGDAPLSRPLPVGHQLLGLRVAVALERPGDGLVEPAASIGVEVTGHGLADPVVVGLDLGARVVAARADEALQPQGLEGAVEGSPGEGRGVHRHLEGDGDAGQRHDLEKRPGLVVQGSDVGLDRILQAGRAGTVGRRGAACVTHEEVEEERMPAGLLGERREVGLVAHQLDGEGGRLLGGQDPEVDPGGVGVAEGGQEVLGRRVPRGATPGRGSARGLDPA